MFLVEEPITIVQAALKLEKGLITKEEFAKFVEERPQEETAVENAQGVSADDAVGTAAAEGAEAHSVDKYLNSSLREIKTLLWHKQKDLERYRRDPDMPKRHTGTFSKAS